MKDRIKKWWNRKWTNWEHFDTIETKVYDRTIQSLCIIQRDLIYKRTSTDGLIQLKKINVF